MRHDMILQNWAAARADALPGAERTEQSVGGWELWKVGGKVFMLQTEMPGEPVVIIKAAPADAESLRETYAQITPGYHMDKRHWITLHPKGTLGQALVEKLVTESYVLVVEGLPRSRRPIDPGALRRGPS